VSWGICAIGVDIVDLRSLGLSSGDDRLKAILGSFMVFVTRVAMMGLSPGSRTGSSLRRHGAVSVGGGDERRGSALARRGIPIAAAPLK
jgi:hypothetical protein